MRRTTVLAALVLAGTTLADPALLPTQARRWFDAVRPRDSELRWRTIPWTTDLDDAITQARLEKRPLLLWTAGDDPLERC
jgi:hypothetical protein